MNEGDTISGSSDPVTPKYPVSWRQRARSLFVVLFLLMSAYLGSIFIMGIFLPFIIFSPSLYFMCIDLSMDLWLMLAEVLLAGVLRIKVRLYGDDFVKTDFPQKLTNSSSISIMNHRTCFDWLFFWCLGSFVRKCKIVLKSQLATVPGAGWAMQMANFIFLKRQIDEDKAHIFQIIQNILQNSGKAQILLFPEGTNLKPKSMLKSDKHAEARGLCPLRHTLYPRHTGFYHFVKNLDSELAYVYDITVAYPYTIPLSEMEFIIGNCPQEVHYFIRKWPISSLLLDDAVSDEEMSFKLGAWLDERWIEKEALLKKYYDMPPTERNFGKEIDRSGSLIKHIGSAWSMGAVFILCFWIIFICTSVGLILTSWIIFIYFVSMNIFFFYNACGFGIGKLVAEYSKVELKFPIPNNIPMDSTEIKKLN